MKTYKLDSEITLTEEQMKEIAEAYNKPEFEYPVFKKNKINGLIVKFTAIKQGVVFWKGPNSYIIGHYSGNWASHTDIEIWEDVAYDTERMLWHGQPIFCWDNNDSHQRVIRFYDAINKSSFTWNGKLNGAPFQNYEAIQPDKYDDWIVKGHKTLEEK